MRTVAWGLRDQGLDVSIPVRWAPPDAEVFAGNVDFGEAEIKMSEFLEVLAQVLTEGGKT